MFITSYETQVGCLGKTTLEQILKTQNQALIKHV